MVERRLGDRGCEAAARFLEHRLARPAAPAAKADSAAGENAIAA